MTIIFLTVELVADSATNLKENPVVKMTGFFFMKMLAKLYKSCIITAYIARYEQ